MVRPDPGDVVEHDDGRAAGEAGEVLHGANQVATSWSAFESVPPAAMASPVESMTMSSRCPPRRACRAATPRPKRCGGVAVVEPADGLILEAEQHEALSDAVGVVLVVDEQHVVAEAELLGDGGERQPGLAAARLAEQ